MSVSAPAGGKATFPAGLQAGLQRKQLPALDGVRAIAAFLVVFYHGGLMQVPGGLGVLAFFVLSGFLITWLLLLEQERYGSISLRAFYARRSLRIFPAFYVYWLIVVLRTAYTGNIVWPQAVASFFYVNNYYQATQGDPNTGLSHTWSLGVEEQFYLLWPVTFIYLQRFTRIQVVRILSAGIVLLWVYRWGLIAIGVDQGYIYEAFDTRADHLLTGCWLAFVLRSGALPALWKTLCSSVLWSIGAVALLVLSTILENQHGAIYRDAVGFVVSPVLVGLLIPQLIHFSGGRIWGWLDWAPIRYLGRISYSVYLYQQLTPNMIEKLLPPLSPIAMTATNAILATMAASVSYFAVERPFLRLKDRFARVAPNERQR
jgi:peptidoglycan/LPS O-acetylase OafA/YrhL